MNKKVRHSQWEREISLVCALTVIIFSVHVRSIESTVNQHLYLRQYFRQLSGAPSIQPQNSETFKHFVSDIFLQRFQKILKLLNFRIANHSNENSRNSGTKIKWNGNSRKEIFENQGIKLVGRFPFDQNLAKFRTAIPKQVPTMLFHDLSRPMDDV